MRIWVTIFLLSVVLPAVARAESDQKKPPASQDSGLGLDLTHEDAKPTEPSPPLNPPSGPDLGPSTSSTSGASEALLGERDITQEDRVKSVQHKLYLKKNRFELAPFVTVSVNDPYYVKFGVSLRGAYYLADTLAIAIRGVRLQVVPTDDVRTAKRTFQSRIFFSVPDWMALADLEWSPVYGKVTIFNSILHFDGYLLGGAGGVVTETAAFPGRPAADLGFGLRFVAKDFLAVNAAIINTSYVDTPTGTTKGSLQNVLTLNAGISLFFPFRSTGREAE